MFDELRDLTLEHLALVLISMAVAIALAVPAGIAATRRPGWRRTAHSERGRLLLALASAVEANAARLAELESRDTGHPIRDTSGLDVPRTILGFRYFAGMADKIEEMFCRDTLGVLGISLP